MKLSCCPILLVDLLLLLLLVVARQSMGDQMLEYRLEEERRLYTMKTHQPPAQHHLPPLEQASGHQQQAGQQQVHPQLQMQEHPEELLVYAEHTQLQWKHDTGHQLTQQHLYINNNNNNNNNYQPNNQQSFQQQHHQPNQLAYYQYYSVHQYQASPQPHDEQFLGPQTAQELLNAAQQHQLNLNLDNAFGQQPVAVLTEQSQHQSCQPQQQQQSVLLMHQHHISINQKSTCSASHNLQTNQPPHNQQQQQHTNNVPNNLATHLALNNNHHHHHHKHQHHQPPATHNSNVDYSLTHHSSSHHQIHHYKTTPDQQNFSMGAAAALRHYWREISALCLLSAICLNCLYLALKRRFFACVLAASSSNNTTSTSLALATSSSVISSQQQQQEDIAAHQSQTRSLSKDTNSSAAQDSAFEDPIPSLSLEGDHSNSSNSCCQLLDKSDKLRVIPTSNATITTRQRSSTLKAEPNTGCEPVPCCSPQLLSVAVPRPAATCSIQTHHNNSVSTSLSSSLTNTSEYVSRYSSDFHSIQRLGRGGFGIVFEALNKIDDCHYAVKRICLPLEKEARERVMREVRALAKLDHAGIVRYYNAWLETPPDEWLKQHDAKLGITHSKDGFPSTDGIYEGQTTRDQQLLNSHNRASGDNSSSLFSGNNNHWKTKPNGLRRYLKNNSSSPSLDIVFEGSGSIRLESDKTEPKAGHNHHQHDDDDDDDQGRDELAKLLEDGSNLSDNNISDSEDSDFIQFEFKGNNACSGTKISPRDLSVSELTDPFSSSDDENEKQAAASDDDSGEDDGLSPLKQNLSKPMDMIRKNAIAYQNKLRKLNNASLGDSLHVEKVYLYIQMQLCRKDTLKDWLKTNCEHRDKTTIFDLFYQIVDAVEYVHSQDLIHRDLKPSNIFFSLDGTLKIGDFGLCRTKTSNGIGSSLDLQEYVAESDVERSFEAVHTEQVGTQLYMSPEQLNGLSYNQKVDIFAMGLILLELLIPFKTQMQRVNVLFKARNNLYSEEFQTEHPLEHELVKSLLSRSPLKRPTANEIKQHQLLANAQLSQPVIERIYHRRRTISSNSSTE